MPRALLFRLGAAHYGLEIGAIQEVADDPVLYALPQGGACLLGAVNLHGRVLPVIDLPALLELAAAPRDRRLIVLSPEFHGLALVVSGVGRITTYAVDEVRPPTAAERSRAIAGVVEAGGREGAVGLLDAGAVVARLQTIYAV